MRGHKKHKPSNARPAPALPPVLAPTPAEAVRANILLMIDSHHRAWHQELFQDHPRWAALLGYHLRLAELEHIESAVEEFQ